MPTPGKHWYHITFSTYNSWLPGDPRGFRSRGHKLHSSGDHRNPPPKGEHAVLHAYAKAHSGQPVLLDSDARSLAGKTVLRNLEKQKHSALAIAVGGNHAHLLVQLPVSRTAVKEAVGRAKLSASMKLKRVIPGRVWARGCISKQSSTKSTTETRLPTLTATAMKGRGCGHFGMVHLTMRCLSNLRIPAALPTATTRAWVLYQNR